MNNRNSPLSDLGKAKEQIMSLLLNDDNVVKLVMMPSPDDSESAKEENWYGRHCFDMPYTEGSITDQRAAIFVESSILSMVSSQVKEVQLTISILCDRALMKLSPADTAYYQTLGIYGNRVDSICQAIDIALLTSGRGAQWSIGNLCLAEKEPVKLFTAEDRFYGKTLSYTYQTYYTAAGSRGKSV